MPVFMHTEHLQYFVVPQTGIAECLTVVVIAAMM